MSKRMGGVQVSSNWPLRTAQMNAARNDAAIRTLNGIKNKMALILWCRRPALRLRLPEQDACACCVLAGPHSNGRATFDLKLSSAECLSRAYRFLRLSCRKWLIDG